MDSLKLVLPPLPDGPPSPHPCRVTAMAGELGAHSLPPSNFISWRGIQCAPSATKHLVVIAEAGVQWDSLSVSIVHSSPHCLLLWVGRKGYQGSSGPLRFSPWARERSAQNRENARLKSRALPPSWEVSVAQSSLGRLPGGGGIGAQPWKTHIISKVKGIRSCLPSCYGK